MFVYGFHHVGVGVDRKTSVLDYVVKRILTKGDPKLLDVTEEISLAETSSKMSGHEIARELQGLVQTVKELEEELVKSKRYSAGTADGPSNAGEDGTAVNGLTPDINMKYISSLEAFVKSTKSNIKEISRVREVMTRKVTEVAEYFGEDASQCDTKNIFSVLVEFRRALLASKTNMTEELNRKQKMSASSSLPLVGSSASPAGNKSSVSAGVGSSGGSGASSGNSKDNFKGRNRK